MAEDKETTPKKKPFYKMGIFDVVFNAVELIGEVSYHAVTGPPKTPKEKGKKKK